MPGEIAKAYVQIIPSTDGISGNLEEELGGASSSAGRAGGSKFAAAFKKIIAAAAIGKVIKDSLMQGMELEQNLGGAEAVFGDFYSNIVSTAQDAYKNLGSSASDYLASANKIGSLLQGSGIDQAQAVDLTANAMQRAADVASVMGISTESAFEAIAGAAKGNFTMMDNLGVAMNATTLEAYAMEQGMSDFSYSAATNAEKAELAFQMFFEKTAQYEGNFARESSETLSGSLGQMKAALSDILGNITLGNDITPYLNNLITSVSDFSALFLPAVTNILSALPSAAVEAMTTLAPTLINEGINAVMSVANGLSSAAPSILAEGVNIIVALANGISSVAPQLITTAAALIPELIIGLANALPQLISSAGQIINAIVSGISQAMPVLIGALPEIITAIVNALIESAPIIAQTALELFMNIVTAVRGILGALGSALAQVGSSIVSAIKGFVGSVAAAAKNVFDQIVTAATNIASRVIAAVRSAITNAINAVKGFVGQMAAAGHDLLLGLAEGIGNAVGAVVAKAREVASNILSSVKSFFGIASPSKLFRDEVGQFLMLGLAEGITGNSDAVTDAIDDVTMMTTKGFESNLGVNAALGVSTDAEATGGLTQLIGLVAELSDKIDRLRLYLDSGELVGGITTDMDNALGNRDALTARGIA